MGLLVAEDRVEAAFEWLQKASEEIEDLVAHAINMEHQRKQIRAKCFLEAKGGPVAEREAKAFADPRYVDACTKQAQAEAALKKAYWLRDRANLIIEAWRSQESTRRSMGKMQ